MINTHLIINFFKNKLSLSRITLIKKLKNHFCLTQFKYIMEILITLKSSLIYTTFVKGKIYHIIIPINTIYLTKLKIFF